MTRSNYIVRSARVDEFAEIGKLMVDVYSRLEGFPKPHEQPNYYKKLANVGELTLNTGVDLLVATQHGKQIVGGVVFFNDMQYYGSGGTATQEKNAAGFRLLAVSSLARGRGVGKLLAEACISKAKNSGIEQVIIHTTQAMQTAWKMYEGMGFKRATDLDFMQGELPVFGFRLKL